jgi:LDH2 family malate/lactate/ureidoglycolate dehydrogenase
MKVSRETLHQLIENKLHKAGLNREHAAIIADVLVYADARGIHSHGAYALNIMRNVLQKADQSSPNFV